MRTIGLVKPVNPRPEDLTHGPLSPSLEGFTFLGFGIGNYRGFTGEQIQRVGPFGKVHVIAGQNNSGKSSLIDFCATGLMNIRSRNYANVLYMSESDAPLSSGEPRGRNVYRVSVAFSKESILSGVKGDRLTEDMKASFDEFISAGDFSHGDPGIVWVDYDFGPERNSVDKGRWVLNPVFPAFASHPGSRFFQDLSLAVCGQASDERGSLATLFGRLCQFEAIPPVKRITAIRHVSEQRTGGDNSDSLTGEGLNDRLSELKSPELADRAAATERWSSFLGFVRGVLNDPDADVDVSSRTHSIAVRTGGTDYLPLSSLGTGIEELVILAAEIACTRDSLICVEEPEIHLHPSLQSRFMRYLMDDAGGNRFLVTTHSATVINTPGATLTQVVKRGGVCKARRVTCSVESRDTLDDLGARPSDLLQTDFVVWVEGPSDRIYVRSWLSRVDHDLAEGMHYSVMFYGGKLLNSLDAGAAERDAWKDSGDDLISLFKINAHFCVLMDSDRVSEKGRANQTKYRIRRECEESGAMAWITDYRTIENYVPERALREAIGVCHPGKKVAAGHTLGDKWTCPLSFTFEGVSYGPDKIAVARRLEHSNYELDSKLRKHVEELAAAIRDANGMPPSADSNEDNTMQEV